MLIQKADDLVLAAVRAADLAVARHDPLDVVREVG
jgi:hypothetical protein